MIQHKKILTGLMTAALILSSHSAMTWSVYASEQQETSATAILKCYFITHIMILH